jgi:hypothetical protein
MMWLPAFTSKKRVSDYVKEPETCLGAAARDLFQMLPNANFWLKPAVGMPEAAARHRNRAFDEWQDFRNIEKEAGTELRTEPPPEPLRQSTDPLSHLRPSDLFDRCGAATILWAWHLGNCEMTHRQELFGLLMFDPSLVDAESIRHFRRIAMRSFNRTAMQCASLILCPP